MDRRQFIASTGAAAAAAAVPSALIAQGAPGDAALNALFERIFREGVADSPELATALGFDKGPGAALKSRLSPRTAAERTRQLGRTQTALSQLRAVVPAGLSPSGRLNREVVIYQLEGRALPADRFGLDAVQRPYRIFQQGGAYFSVPDFLNSSHTIETAADAEGYLARLAAFATSLDQDSEEQRAQAARGYLAPGWSLDLTLGQMAKLRGVAPASSTLVTSLANRARAKGIAGDWAGRATAIVSGQVYPALDRQIALVQTLRRTTPAGDGVWRVPQGEAIYAAALEQATTTKFTPDEVHRIGLEQVAQLQAELDTVLRAAGLTTGSVGARLAALNVRPEQVYANTDAGRAELIASLNTSYQAIAKRMPQAFATLPKAPMEIRRVPAEIQDGASNGYYRGAALDGSRAAIYYINLKDTGDWPKYSLPSLTYHEGVPGHHLQIALAQESRDIPLIRKSGGFSAYSEGWALYSEQLSAELGAYEGIERAGYLQSFLFRAARLVVDTGLHDKRWTKERATDYLVETTGFARPRTQREIERYCTQPGQACSYKIGHIAWERARAKAKATLGAKFDLKQFHEVLKDGAMPLTILERRIEERTAERARA